MAENAKDGQAMSSKMRKKIDYNTKMRKKEKKSFFTIAAQTNLSALSLYPY